ncbi:MAG: hypothetical protein AAB664_01070, partial [Patescibacteria group bacterium]
MKQQSTQMQQSGGLGPGRSTSQMIHLVSPDSRAYQSVLLHVRPQVNHLREALRVLRIPTKTQLRGLTEGEFDLEALPAFVSGRYDIMMIEQQALKMDLAIAILRDVSGSMSGHQNATHLSVALNEALLGFEKEISTHFYGFHDDVFDCGMAQKNNGIAGLICNNGTNETFGLQVAGEWLAKQKRKRKLLVTVCDGAPADVESVRKTTQALLRQGILPMRILVGVD